MAGYTDPLWIEHEGYPVDSDGDIITVRHEDFGSPSGVPRVGMSVRRGIFVSNTFHSCPPSSYERVGKVVRVHESGVDVLLDVRGLAGQGVRRVKK